MSEQFRYVWVVMDGIDPVIVFDNHVDAYQHANKSETRTVHQVPKKR